MKITVVTCRYIPEYAHIALHYNGLVRHRYKELQSSGLIRIDVPILHGGSIRRLLVAVLASACELAHASIESQVGAGALAKAVETSLHQEGLVGASWALVDGEATRVGSAGARDARLGEPLLPTHRVQVGSVTKTVLAAGVLRLATEGRVSLDAPLAELLPGIVLENAWSKDHPVRLRHLLDHTSGLDDARLWQVFGPSATPDAPLAESLGKDRSILRVRYRPGARLSYSNVGYTLLGMVIEAVTGERYEAHLDAHLLRPLGMHDSTFRFRSQAGTHADALLAMGHFEEGVAHSSVPTHVRPATQFTTTPADMAAFARFLMGDGEIDGKPFIAAGLLRAMGTPSTTESAAAGLVAGYGLGLGRRDRHGVVGYCHVGTTVGFRGNLCLFPAERKAFFVAFNADSEDANYEKFDALLVRALGVKVLTPAAASNPPPGIEGCSGLYVPMPVRMQSFAYLDFALNFATVRWDGARLNLAPFQGAAKSLVPAGGSLLRAEGQVTASHVLLARPGGPQAISDGFRTYERVSAWRIGPIWASLAAGLAGLVFVVVAGATRVARRRLAPADAMFFPFLASLALLVPAPLFLGQSLLQLGDVTAASISLAVVTAALPLAMAFGLWRWLFRRERNNAEATAMAAVLQWTGVLAWWGLLPLRLWA